VLWPGHSTRVRIAVDPRLLAVWDTRTPGWSTAPGAYTLAVGDSARDLGPSARVILPRRHLPPQWKP